MKRSIIAIILAVLALSALGGIVFRRRPAPERFVLIVVDSLRPDHLGCYGDRRHLTPHLDAAAGRGVRFAQCWSASSWTIESNAGLFTGLYPSQIRAGDGMRLRRDAVTLAESFRAAGYATAAFSAHAWISPEFGFAQGFKTFDVASRGDDRVVDACVRWVRKHRTGRYFELVYLWGPHFPYQPANIPPALSARLAALPSSSRKGYIPISGRDRRLTLVPRATGKEGQASADEVAALRELYALSVRELDARIGRVLRAIGDDGRCVVAVTADHGEEFLEHGFIYHEMSLYQELLHVPLVIRVPGVAPAIVEQPVSGLDIMPTLLSLARIPRPNHLVGQRLFPASAAASRLLFSEVDITKGSHALRYGVRAGDSAVIYSLSGCPPEKPVPPGGRWEVYDLAHDPKQRHPRAAPKADLRAALVAHARDGMAARATAARGNPATPAARAEMMRQFRALGYLAPQ